MEKTIISCISLLFLAIFINSCGQKVQELENVAKVVKNLPEASEKANATSEIANKKIEERKAKGDTLAMNFKELINYLPKSIDGYKSADPEGSSTNAMGFSFSQASNTYSKMIGDKEESIRIELVDYNASYEYLTGIAYWTTLNISTESSKGFERTTKADIDNAYAYEKYDNESKSGSITYILGYRFILTINGENINSFDELKSIANKIDLKKLASF